MVNEPVQIDGIARRTVLKASAVGAGVLGASVPATASGNDEKDDQKPDDPDREPADKVVTQTTDVVGQGEDGPVVAEEGATIWRTSNEILIDFSMSTPEPGEYTYPSEPAERKGEWWTDEAGELEAFTLWAFIFNNPEDCENGCDSGDLGEPAGGGVFDVSGAVSDGGDLTLNGFVSTDTELYEEDGEPMGVPLERPREAEVHLAVAPHGAFDPDMMPEILQTPAATADEWWVALFDPPA